MPGGVSSAVRAESSWACRIRHGGWLLCMSGRNVPPCVAAGGGPVTYGWWAGYSGGSEVTGAEPSGGRCIMSRSGVYYAVKAMERAAAGTAADGVPGARGRPARAAARPRGRIASWRRRLLAAAHLGMGGARGEAGQGSRRLGGAARPSPAQPD